MSTFHAIAGVTALLTDLLNNGLVDLNVDGTGGHTTVSALAPHLVDPPGANQNHPKQLNLFLYQITPNQGWHNSNLPSRNSDGQRLTNPPLAIDLHYLLTAYASKYLETEILLGQAMLLLHENPLLSRDGIRHLIANPPALTDDNDKARLSIELSELSEQLDGLKITPQYLSTEEVSRLWAALQAPYHPTVAYQVSVVLIESKRRTRATLPVREARVHVMPFEHVHIEKVLSKKGTGPVLEQPITVDQTLVIRGQHLRGQVTNLRIGGKVVAPTVIGATELEATLAADLRAGVQTVQVIHDLDFGTPTKPDPHRGFESNAAAFVLRPNVTSPVFANGNPKTITLTFDPPVGRSQRVSLLLNPLVPVGANTYRFDAPLHNGITTAAQEETTSISFSINDVPAGKYLVRAQVDGAESPLDFDNTTKQYNNPIVEVT
jgi:Pvc16 N-terminal domain